MAQEKIRSFKAQTRSGPGTKVTVDFSRQSVAAGYDHRLAIGQREVSLTHVFDQPIQGRHFFEAVIREHLDLGRPDRVGLLFPLHGNHHQQPVRLLRQQGRR